MGAAGMIGQVAGGTLNSASTTMAWGAQKERLAYETRAADQNRQIAGAAAQSADERGAQQEEQSRLKYGAIKGNQATAYGASGVAVDSGSPTEAMANTQAMSDYDAKVIQNNAAREAWGNRQKADQFQQQRDLLRDSQSNADVEFGLKEAGGLIGSVGGMFGGMGGGSSGG
jgi:hypothetical protein